ncbi:MAG: FeoA domain-containing protein [Dehalococcoidales bacterium]
MISWRKRKCIKPICDLREGDKGTIVQIRGKIAEHRYLCIMGITVGRSLSIQSVMITPRERIVTVKAGDIELVLDKYLSHNIQLEMPVIDGDKKPLNLQKEYAKVA